MVFGFDERLHCRILLGQYPRCLLEFAFDNVFSNVRITLAEPLLAKEVVKGGLDRRDRV